MVFVPCYTCRGNESKGVGRCLVTNWWVGSARSEDHVGVKKVGDDRDGNHYGSKRNLSVTCRVIPRLAIIKQIHRSVLTGIPIGWQSGGFVGQENSGCGERVVGHNDHSDQ